MPVQWRKLENGRYEQCQPHRSRNSNHIVSSVALFHPQRHGDHRAPPTRSYQLLRDFPELPMLPSGYFGSLATDLPQPRQRRVAVAVAARHEHHVE